MLPITSATCSPPQLHHPTKDEGARGGQLIRDGQPAIVDQDPADYAPPEADETTAFPDRPRGRVVLPAGAPYMVRSGRDGFHRAQHRGDGDGVLRAEQRVHQV